MKHPFINDLSGKSLEELQQTVSSLTSKLSYAYRMGNAPLIHQLRMVIESYQEEARKLQQQIAEQLTKPDQVNHPKHYTSHPSGVECIEITRHMGYNLGNAVKYIWRCDLKRDAIEDLRKAIWYLQDELAVREEKQNV